MIKKLLVVLNLLLLVFLAVSPFYLYALEENLATESGKEGEEYDFASMTTYELFWPIVAGKVPGDRFYQLKAWRDKLVGYLFFSKVKKSEYLKRLANKRLVEAVRLLELQRYSFFPETIQIAGDNLEKGAALLFSAEQSSETAWLKEEYRKDLRKHLIVLERMKDQAKEEHRGTIETGIQKIESLIE